MTSPRSSTSPESARNGVQKTALVTGGAIRVGAAITRALVEAGYRVWLHYNRSAAAAQALASEHSHAIRGVIQADLSVAHQRASLVESIRQAHNADNSPFDLLVNSAASFEDGRFLERSDADLERVLATNLIAPISLCRQLAPLLAANVAGDASIVNIVDLGALHPLPNYLDHSVAKAGLAMATRGLACELAPQIRINAIAPGTVIWPPGPKYEIGSPWRDEIEAAIPLGEIGTAEDVAQAVLYFAQARHTNGQILAIDGGRSANFGR